MALEKRPKPAPRVTRWRVPEHPYLPAIFTWRLDLTWQFAFSHLIHLNLHLIYYISYVFIGGYNSTWDSCKVKVLTEIDLDAKLCPYFMWNLSSSHTHLFYLVSEKNISVILLLKWTPYHSYSCFDSYFKTTIELQMKMITKVNQSINRMQEMLFYWPGFLMWSS